MVIDKFTSVKLKIIKLYLYIYIYTDRYITVIIITMEETPIYPANLATYSNNKL